MNDMPDLKDILPQFKSDETSIDSLILKAKKDKYIGPKIKEFELNDDEIIRYYPLLSAYAEDMEAESVCPGIENCSLPTPHFISELRFEDGELVRTVGYCPCYKKVVNRERGFMVKDFDRSLLNVSAAKLKYGAGKELLKTFLNAAKSETKNWSFVYDQTQGSAKYIIPYLGWASEQGKKVAFVDYPKFVEKINKLSKIKNYDNPAFDPSKEEIELLENVNVLAINNFGSEYKSDYTRDTILMPILRKRSLDKSETIIISSFERKDIKDLYSGNNASSRISVKELENILKNNIFKETVFIPGIEERF